MHPVKLSFNKEMGVLAFPMHYIQIASISLGGFDTKNLSLGLLSLSLLPVVKNGRYRWEW